MLDRQLIRRDSRSVGHAQGSFRRTAPVRPSVSLETLSFQRYWRDRSDS